MKYKLIKTKGNKFTFELADGSTVTVTVQRPWLQVNIKDATGMYRFTNKFKPELVAAKAEFFLKHHINRQGAKK